MTVGTWASNPDATTSPIFPPATRRINAVLDVAIEIEGPGATFTTDTRLAIAAEGLAQVADEEAVVPDEAGRDLRCHPLCSLLVIRHHHSGKAVFGVISDADPLCLFP